MRLLSGMLRVYLKKNKTINKLLSNFFSLSVLKIFSYILPLLILPYLIRILGVEKFGLVMFAQSFIIFFNIFIEFGFGLSATREISLYRNDKDKITEIFSSVLSIKLILLLFSFIFLNLIIFNFNRFSSDWLLYELSFLMIIGEAVFAEWYFLGIEEMKYITILTIFSNLLYTILIFIVIKSQNDYIYVIFLKGLSSILIGCISLYIIFLKYHQKFKIQKFSILRNYFKDTLEFFFSKIAVMIYRISNTFILGIFTNNTIVGYYNISEKLYSAIYNLYQPIVQVLYPHMSKEKNVKMFKKIYFMLLTLTIPLLIIIYYYTPNLLSIITKTNDISDSIDAFRLFLVVLCVVISSTLVGYPLLAALGHKKIANYSMVFGASIHVLLLLILIFIHKVDITHIIYSVLITETSILFIRYYAIFKYKLFKD